MKLELIVGQLTQNKNGVFLNELPLSQLHTIITAAMHHLVAVFLGLRNQDLVQLHLYLRSNATSHIRVCLLFRFVNRNSRQLFTKGVVVLNVLILRHVLENEAEDVPKLLSGLDLHVATHVLGLLLELPFKTRPWFAAFIDSESNCVHVEVYGQLAALLIVSSEVDCVGTFNLTLTKGNCAIFKSVYRDIYLMFRVSLTT
jgi:hypothetical protein